MIHYIQPQLLTEICAADSPSSSLGTILVEVIANVLDNEVSASAPSYLPWGRLVERFNLEWRGGGFSRAR